MAIDRTLMMIKACDLHFGSVLYTANHLPCARARVHTHKHNIPQIHEHSNHLTHESSHHLIKKKKTLDFHSGGSSGRSDVARERIRYSLIIDASDEV